MFNSKHLLLNLAHSSPLGHRPFYSLKWELNMGASHRRSFLSQQNSHLLLSFSSLIKIPLSSFRSERQLCYGFGARLFMACWLIQTQGQTSREDVFKPICGDIIAQFMQIVELKHCLLSIGPHWLRYLISSPIFFMVSWRKEETWY